MRCHRSPAVGVARLLVIVVCAAAAAHAFPWKKSEPGAKCGYEVKYAIVKILRERIVLGDDSAAVLGIFSRGLQGLGYYLKDKK